MINRLWLLFIVYLLGVLHSSQLICSFAISLVTDLLELSELLDLDFEDLEENFADFFSVTVLAFSTRISSSASIAFRLIIVTFLSIESVLYASNLS